MRIGRRDDDMEERGVYGPQETLTPAVRYRRERMSHWDGLGRTRPGKRFFSAYYHDRLTEIYRFVVPEGSRVLEIGCGQGDLLAALKPSVGVGLDFAPSMIARGREKYPRLRFVEADAHDLDLGEEFDYIIMSDLVNDLWDVQTVFEKVRAVAAPTTRVVINTYSRLWELPLAAARALNLAEPLQEQNWLTFEDLGNLLELSGFEIVRHWVEILFPLRFPLVSSLCNRVLAKLWPLTILDLCHFIVARPRGVPYLKEAPRVSVIVPARNEAGNIRAVLERTPEMGAGTEIVFVEGHSTDGTYEAIAEAIKTFPTRRCILLRQEGTGKGDAVRLGFRRASGDILMILDADLTVPPEDLPRFYRVLVSGMGEFANGVRLVYPRERRAMRFFNLCGNKFFSLAFTWLLGQPVKDTLCGTKALWRRDYERIAALRSYFGEFDPFGDFDLLFGAAKMNLKIRDIPVRYRERTYGETNIRRWRHGWLLLRMVLFALRRMKFV